MKKNSGFTLIELMITLAIVAILLTVGVPSLKTFMRGSQLVASTNELISALHVARSEAIKRGSRVSICSSSNGTSCSGATTWENGWIVFADAAGTFVSTGARCTAPNTNCLLRVQDGVDASQLTVVGVDQNANNISAFTFSSRGLPKDTNNIAQSGVFNICSLDSGTTTDSRAVILNLSGRVRVSDNSAVITQCP